MYNPRDYEPTADDTPLYDMIGSDEKIIWTGKPDKKCFLLESIFNPMLPFALVWALFDGFFIAMLSMADKGAKNAPPLIFMVLFFCIHLMPVWIYLGGVLFSFLSHKHTSYVITDKAVYVSGGTFSVFYKRKAFSEIAAVEIHRGMVDQWLGVGDVELVEKGTPSEIFSQLPTAMRMAAAASGNKKIPLAANKPFSLCDLADYRQVYELVKDLNGKAQQKPEN